MKKLLKTAILFLILTVSCIAQISPPSAYTPNYRLRLYLQGANPSADSINANWIQTDLAIKTAFDSANSSNILKTYGNYNIYGNRSYKSGYIAMDGARFFFGNNTITSPLFVGEIAPTTNRTYLTYTNISATDTFAMRSWVRDNFTFSQTGYRIIYSDASTSTSGTATQKEYSFGNATSNAEATTQNIKIPFYKTGDEDSLILHFRAYYFLDGNSLNQARIRFWIDGDPPFTDSYYGVVNITNDDSYGYTSYKLSASISSLPVGFYYIGIAGSIDLDTYTSGTARIYLTRPVLMVRY